METVVNTLDKDVQLIVDEGNPKIAKSLKLESLLSATSAEIVTPSEKITSEGNDKN